MEDDRSRSLKSEATRLADAARDRAADTLEDVKVASGQVVDRVRDLIEEGNVRRISLRKGDRVLFEIPLTVGVGAGAAALLTSPLLAAVGAVAALVSDITIVVERDDEAAADPATATPTGASAPNPDASTTDTAKTAGKPAGSADAVSNVNEPPPSASGDTDAKTVGKPTGGAAGDGDA